MKHRIRAIGAAAVLHCVTAVFLAFNGATHAQESAPPTPPQSEIQKWIATTDAQWQATFKRDVTDVREAELTKVKEQYRTSLDAAIAKASAAGDLDGAVVLRNEQERLFDTKTFPEQDLASEGAAVKQFRAASRIALAKLEKDHATRVRALHAKYDQLLAQAQTQLTQRQRLDDALEVKAKRDEVAAVWITPALAVDLEDPKKGKESLGAGGPKPLVIVSAILSAGKRKRDVTRLVQMAVSDNKIQLKVPWPLGRDLEFGTHKMLTIRYRQGAAENTAMFVDTETVNLP